MTKLTLCIIHRYLLRLKKFRELIDRCGKFYEVKKNVEQFDIYLRTVLFIIDSTYGSLDAHRKLAITGK